jgi:vesicle transport protein SEC22
MVATLVCLLYFNFFSYLIENDVCYLVLAEKNYSKRLAFSYLEELAQEFHSQYGKKVNTVTRPYSFIEFGKKKRVKLSIISRNLWVRNIILLYNVLF